MALALTKSGAQSRGVKRRQIPSKRSINLAVMGEKSMKMGVAVPSVILIVVAAVLFSKFLVIDRLAEVAAAQRQVSELQARLDAGYEELADFDDLNELYAHYTYSGMTAEELQRTDRSQVLALIQKVLLPRVGVGDWSLSGNELTINVTGGTLQQINMAVQQLEQEELVDFCTVTTASSNDYRRVILDQEEDVVVTARVVVYLNSIVEVALG